MCEQNLHNDVHAVIQCNWGYCLISCYRNNCNINIPIRPMYNHFLNIHISFLLQCQICLISSRFWRTRKINEVRKYKFCINEARVIVLCKNPLHVISRSMSINYPDEIIIIQKLQCSIMALLRRFEQGQQ